MEACDLLIYFALAGKFSLKFVMCSILKAVDGF